MKRTTPTATAPRPVPTNPRPATHPRTPCCDVAPSPHPPTLARRRPTRPRSQAARPSTPIIPRPEPSPGQVHHPTRSHKPRDNTATPVTVSPTGPIHHPLAWVRPPTMFHPPTGTGIPGPRHLLSRSSTGPFTPFFPTPKTGKKGGISRPPKMGQNRAEKTTAKICDTLHVCFSLELLAIHPLTGPRLCRLHKFVTPLRYKIPPFSLAQPRAKICDTPQIRNTPIFPGTALAANGAHFKRAKKAKISPKSAGEPNRAKKCHANRAKICDTPQIQNTPFSLAQPRAKICDTPQLRNTPIFLGTAPRKNLIQL